MTDLGKAQRKIADYLSKRPYSRFELNQKLTALSEWTPEVIESALNWATHCALLGDENLLAEQVRQQLQRKGKGSLYIRNYLENKGLPLLAIDAESERENAQRLINKEMLNFESPLSREDKTRLARFLTNRGFHSDIIREIIFHRL